MNILFELSKEHPTLPFSEICGCLKANNFSYDIIEYNTEFVFLKINCDNIDSFSKRLSMSFSINEVISKSLEGFMKNIKIRDNFKVTGGSLKFRQEFGKLISDEKNVRVNLTKPNHIFKVFKKGDASYFCVEKTRINRSDYEKRRPSRLPFSVPTGMHPKIARTLVNIAQLKKNDRFLDPFCGSGGILIEAGLLGARVIGIDIKIQLIKGCTDNLEFIGINNFELINQDIQHLDNIKVDAVVTDFPYGRSSHISNKLETLYYSAFKFIAESTKKAVIGLPSLRFNREIKQFFNIKQIHCFRSHKSLVRYFYELETS